MANEHYKHGSVETRELADEVMSHLWWMNYSDAVDVFNFVKYVRRAGFKDAEGWEADARKAADYLTHMVKGKYLDQLEAEWREGNPIFHVGDDEDGE